MPEHPVQVEQAEAMPWVVQAVRVH